MYDYIQLPSYYYYHYNYYHHHDHHKKKYLLCIPFLYLMPLRQFDVLFYSPMFHRDDWLQKWFQTYACEQLYCWQILSYSCDTLCSDVKYLTLPTYCPICERTVSSHSKKRYCTCCYKHVHRNCCGLLGQNFERASQDISWFCRMCTETFMPFNHIESESTF